jgi:hypothetical protein
MQTHTHTYARTLSLFQSPIDIYPHTHTYHECDGRVHELWKIHSQLFSEVLHLQIVSGKEKHVRCVVLHECVELQHLGVPLWCGVVLYCVKWCSIVGESECERIQMHENQVSVVQSHTYTHTHTWMYRSLSPVLWERALTLFLRKDRARWSSTSP